MNLPNAKQIMFTLASEDGKLSVDVRAPVSRYAGFPYPVPRPAEHRIVDDTEIGYLWLRDCFFGLGVAAFEEAWPKLQNTKGLILDLRDNEGGNLELLDRIAARLLPASHQRQVVGVGICAKGDRGFDGGLRVDVDTTGLSTDGRAVVREFLSRFKTDWQPPAGISTERFVNLLARFGAEPKLRKDRPETLRLPTYSHPIVVLTNHRTFSSAEILTDALRQLGNAKVVGSKTTAGGGGSEHWHPPLKHSKLRLVLADEMYLLADGKPIDGRGIAADIVVEPDADTYTGGPDRMLNKAIEVLKKKTAIKHRSP
jgi:C-terminal processing protease CtpA/Prc